jgi:hypothetical protein
LPSTRSRHHPFASPSSSREIRSFSRRAEGWLSVG